MKVKLEDVLSNPYRNTEKYPVSEDKVRRLQESYKRRGYWGGLKGRPSPTVSGKFELCFGEHRKEALIREGMTEIELDVKDYTNAQMLHMLVGENEEFLFKRSPKFIDENVEGAKILIEQHINENNGEWNKLDDWCKELFEGETGFLRSIEQNKVPGFKHLILIGKQIISKFLGPEWKIYEIEQALQRIKEELAITIQNEDTGEKEKISVPISREALETFEKLEHADAASKAFKSPTGRVAFSTKEDQEIVIEDLHKHSATTGERLTGRSIKEYIHNVGSEILDRESKPLVTEPITDEEKIPMDANRKFFRNTRVNFRDRTYPVSDIHPYPEHMMHYDRALLLRDICFRLKRLKEYDDALGYTSITNTRVYDAIDCDTAEEFKIMKAHLGIETDSYGELPPVEEWFEEDVDSIIDELQEYIEENKPKRRFS